MKKRHSTILLTKEEARIRNWFILDALGKTLGRFAAEIAKVLRGKHNSFTPHVDAGDGVVIINAQKIVVTGAKRAQKIYRYHTGAMSGMREIRVLALPDEHGDGHAPGALAAHHPIGLGIDHAANAVLAGGRNPTSIRDSLQRKSP